ncbi:MAG: PP2C family protein-serine/threonine phosphatase [Rudaea sp.]
MAPTSTEHLGLLYRLSQTFNSSLDLGCVLNDVMDEVIAAVHAERGFLMLHEPSGELVFKVARGLDHRTIASPQFQISRGVVERVADEGKPRLTSDAQADSWLSGRVSVAGLGLRSVLCVPIQLKGATLGVIYVDNRLQAGIFTQADLELLSAIASTAAIAIENARLYEVAVEKGRMERELQVAREVQSRLIPRETPKLDGWEFATLWRPAHVVGGDFFDFMPTSSGRLGVAIADVAGKGMGAALFMAVTRSILRASAMAVPGPAACIEQANRLLCADTTRGMFVTLFYAEFASGSGKVTFVNAGHNPPIVHGAGSPDLGELRRTGLPLGIYDTRPYREETVELAPGDTLLLYTDGITETKNKEEREWGVDSLRRLVLESRAGSAGEFVSTLDEAARHFGGSAAQSDDMTVVLARRL